MRGRPQLRTSEYWRDYHRQKAREWYLANRERASAYQKRRRAEARQHQQDTTVDEARANVRRMYQEGKR